MLVKITPAAADIYRVIVRHWRTAVLGLVALAVVVTTAAALTTSRASVSATTANESNLFTSGRIDVEANTRQELLLSHDGLYPGLVIESCFDVHYRGTIAGSDVRFFGETTYDSGLHDQLAVAVWTGTGATDATCEDFEADGGPRFEGTLRELWLRYPDYTNGLALMADAEPDEHVAVRVRAGLVDGERVNQAQGAVSDFVAVVEARP